ncbi:unnamed protein product [Musa acuminata subsp. malaccensis]|uniref:(wild Malaysian banana) hypothetical protein n=1 Tax=Musa acuminata subsp. malaccensis TaxID=214687 RepID=A0A804K0L5_MUSAM|nr:unnamed protein product [Musa acuminata subsp. malaccensis]
MSTVLFSLGMRSDSTSSPLSPLLFLSRHRVQRLQWGCCWSRWISWSPSGRCKRGDCRRSSTPRLRSLAPSSSPLSTAFWWWESDPLDDGSGGWTTKLMGK